MPNDEWRALPEETDREYRERVVKELTEEIEYVVEHWDDFKKLTKEGSDADR